MCTHTSGHRGQRGHPALDSSGHSFLMGRAGNPLDASQTSGGIWVVFVTAFPPWSLSPVVSAAARTEWAPHGPHGRSHWPRRRDPALRAEVRIVPGPAMPARPAAPLPDRPASVQKHPASWCQRVSSPAGAGLPSCLFRRLQGREKVWTPRSSRGPGVRPQSVPRGRRDSQGSAVTTAAGGLVASPASWGGRGPSDACIWLLLRVA